MDLMQAVRSRRSVRRFSERPLEPGMLAGLVEAARWAPSWANLQTTRYVAVQQPGLRAALRECVPAQNPAHKALGQAPAIVAVCGRRGYSGFHRQRPSNRHGDYFLFDAGLATQNLVLRATEMGLGTCLVGVFDVDRVAALLKLPDGTEPIVLCPVGFAAREPGSGPGRRDVDELLYLDRHPT